MGKGGISWCLCFISSNKPRWLVVVFSHHVLAFQQAELSCRCSEAVLFSALCWCIRKHSGDAVKDLGNSRPESTEQCWSVRVQSWIVGCLECQCCFHLGKFLFSRNNRDGGGLRWKCVSFCVSFVMFPKWSTDWTYSFSLHIKCKCTCPFIGSFPH